jgi:hypothetical protein
MGGFLQAAPGVLWAWHDFFEKGGICAWPVGDSRIQRLARGEPAFGAHGRCGRALTSRSQLYDHNVQYDYLSWDIPHTYLEAQMTADAPSVAAE